MAHNIFTGTTVSIDSYVELKININNIELGIQKKYRFFINPDDDKQMLSLHHSEFIPFGLSDAPLHFQAFMNSILFEKLEKNNLEKIKFSSKLQNGSILQNVNFFFDTVTYPDIRCKKGFYIPKYISKLNNLKKSSWNKIEELIRNKQIEALACTATNPTIRKYTIANSIKNY
ncbi:hypothetical protein BCR32DRAFT_285556 [Anaeromyces robustus]|uniref:Uncharacterized protein n=1 Tax=Anaeromyces robustus TaxID=1754192 RepID=A0A1Y1WJ11_9FUNG|nr:hypothetical protein BCR32DRAFT_285556 [Anaeromyces robustus]|eukprot:ORX73527.1 hypothetical protein BCR32DRAFT_285556 [Anaeromyces robustus]